MKIRNSLNQSVILKGIILGAVMCVHAEEANTGIARIANSVGSNLSALADLVGQVAFLAGLLFFVSAVFKFKQHKDNPTQVPIGTPLSMLAISAALMFMGNFIAPLGETLFGEGAQTGRGASDLTSGFGGTE